MKILIIEDELHNQRLIQGMIQEIRPHWQIAGVMESVSESIEWLKDNSPDLIFMDIQLVDGICFSIFEQVHVKSPVIFTTAYDNFAIQAFKVNSIDYLLKPIKDEELKRAIKKFERQNQPHHEIENYNEILDAIRKGEKKYRTRFLIQGSKAYFKINTSEIAYFYSQNKITFAITFENKEHIIDFTLETLEEELNPDQFFRANRNMIIHIDAVEKFEDYFGGKLYLKLNPPFHEEVTISRLKNSAFKAWVGK
ncbi:MAG: response regulator transcription factor [Marinilabiliaceae bacterium]|nr:response regulator transcription factor [Marinilabiliaceae bacterium]